MQPFDFSAGLPFNKAKAPRNIGAAREVRCCRDQPVVGDKCTNDETLHGGENDVRLLRSRLADLPRITSRVVQAAGSSSTIMMTGLIRTAFLIC